MIMEDIELKYKLDRKDPSVKSKKDQTLKEVGEIKDKIALAIAQEIEKDPTIKGYKGKTPEEVAALLNESVDGVPPRIHTILLGIPYAPNAVTAEDIAAFLKS